MWKLMNKGKEDEQLYFLIKKNKKNNIWPYKNFYENSQKLTYNSISAGVHKSATIFSIGW